jgi:hypothetical protein
MAASMKTTFRSVSAWCVFSLALMLFPQASHSQARVGSGVHSGTGPVGTGTGPVGVGTGTGTGQVGIGSGTLGTGLTGIGLGTGPNQSSDGSYDPTNGRIWDVLRMRAADYAAQTAWAKKAR